MAEYYPYDPVHDAPPPAHHHIQHHHQNEYEYNAGQGDMPGFIPHMEHYAPQHSQEFFAHSQNDGQADLEEEQQQQQHQQRVAKSPTPVNVEVPRHVNIKTKFPVARIKRIMQADEDVGKVAQVTPVVVSKALELFMISLCDKASIQARNRSSKRVTAGHLKAAILAEDQFDFLVEQVNKIPDAPTAAETTGGSSEGEEVVEEPKGRRGKGGRRRRRGEE